MKLEGYMELNGAIVLKEGLRIGGTKEAVGIGETDNPIIRHPITRKPYVPGSSIKGKIRSLLEQKYSPHTQKTGRPCECSECDICRLFGSGDPRGGKEPTRLIFRDAPLSKESETELQESLPGSFVEVKTEIAMDRNRGAARSGALRTQERIPAGAKFDFSFTVRLFEEDKARRGEYFKKLSEAFEMLEKDYLGGSGTRGYGQVQVMTTDGKKHMSEYIRDLQKT
jgi:CRISPR-associated protein Csm3